MGEEAVRKTKQRKRTEIETEIGRWGEGRDGSKG